MATPETFRALLAANTPIPHRIDLTNRTRNLCHSSNQFLYKHAHEPSLAGHRIQEHTYKTVPVLKKEQAGAAETSQNLKGVSFDLEYTSGFLDALDDSIRNSVEAREIVSELASKVSAQKSQRLAASRLP